MILQRLCRTNTTRRAKRLCSPKIGIRIRQSRHKLLISHYLSPRTQTSSFLPEVGNPLLFNSAFNSTTVFSRHCFVRGDP
jgi:hypothetical protein